MQEEVEHKMMLMVEGAAKMTPRVFLRALKLARKTGAETVKIGWKGARLPSSIHKHNLNKERHGKMTVKQLARQNRGGVISQVEVTAENIGSFIPIAKKYGIDFALRRIKPWPVDGKEITGKDTYLIFFKGVDEDTVKRAFDEYIARYSARKEKKQPVKDSKKKKTIEKSKVQKRAKHRARENRPSLLKRLSEKKREVEDQQRERQRSHQELSR